MNEQVDMSLVVGILITMVFSAFFSGMEIAFVSSNRMLAEMDKEKNGLTQRLLSLFYNHPNGFVSTMLVGNNIALVVYGILIARLFDNTIFAGFDQRCTGYAGKIHIILGYGCIFLVCNAGCHVVHDAGYDIYYAAAGIGCSEAYFGSIRY